MKRGLVGALLGMVGLCAGASCAGVGGGDAGRSVFPIRSAVTEVKKPELPFGWKVAPAMSRADFMRLFETLDLPRTEVEHEEAVQRYRRLVWFEMRKNEAGTWVVKRTSQWWEDADVEGLRDPNVEEIWVDKHLREIGLSATAPGRCHIVDPGERAKVGFNVCTSSFAAPGAPVGGKYPTNIDEHALAEAVKQAGVIASAEGERPAAEVAYAKVSKASEQALADHTKARIQTTEAEKKGGDVSSEPEQRRVQLVGALNDVLANGYLPRFGSHVEYRGDCVLHAEDKDLKLNRLNHKFLTNVEWIKPPIGEVFYKITIADNGSMRAAAVKVSSQQTAQQVVTMLEELGASCGAW